MMKAKQGKASFGKQWHGVSVLIATKNQEKIIGECVQACLDLDYPKNKLEVIAVDDGSTDNNLKVLESFGSKIKVFTEGIGRIEKVNNAFNQTRFEFVCVSAGDIVFKRDFLKTIMRFFTHDNIAFVSPFSPTGGNATVYRKKAVLEAGGLFAPEFNDKKTGFRDDTDLVFRLWDKGFESVFSYAPKFKHEHKSPKSFSGKLRYAWSRLAIHKFDALLFKKHPEKGKEFFDVKFGFLRNPVLDFEAATGKWGKQFGLKKEFALSSPQGVKLVEGNNLLSKFAVIAGAIVYVLLVKCVRLYSSLKYGKLLL